MSSNMVQKHCESCEGIGQRAEIRNKYKNCYPSLTSLAGVRRQKGN